jgi:predicted ATPase
MLQQSKGQLATEVEDCFRTANDIAREQGALFWELRTAVSLARLRMTQGRHHEVGQLLAPVYDRFTEGFDTPILRTARTLLGHQPA